MTRNPVFKKKLSGDKLFVSLLVLLNVFFLLPGSGGNAILTQGDEAMHVATIRESLSTSSFLFPKFEGVLNLYKPPALFWLGIFSDSLFGVSFFAERFPSFLLFCGTSLLIYLGLRRGSATAKLSFTISIAYTLTLGVFKFSRLVMMESLLTFFIILVSVSILEFRISKNRFWLFAGGLFSGIAILIKGPVFQVYSGIILGSYSILRIFILSPKGVWTGKRRIWQELFSHSLFHFSSLIVPAIWVLVLVSYSDLGKEFLKVFFFTENLGKFSTATANQGEWIIPVGFFLYSFPFSLGIFYGFYSKLFFRTRSVRELVGSSFLWATVAICLVHLSPNRKDFYYLLPLIPLAFLGIGLFLVRKNELEFSKLLSINFAFCLGAAVLILGGMWTFGILLEQKIWAELVFSAFLLLVFVWKRKLSAKKEGVPSITAANLILAAGLLAYIQFSILPRLNLNEVPEEGPILQAKHLCVISENPWTALTFKNALPDAEIVHSVPGADRNCVDGSRYLVFFQEQLPIPSGYELIQTQAVWKRDVTLQELLSPTKGKEYVYFYRPTRNQNSELESR
ncbi:ArnT family glycosyltransferase [Leptospira sarikeiensis]|uniref:Phospholipid carrier-dependent glycosyltransferase n=1 Tax=Leptospira sarikeiensis TaxID=2484943 RepID=A0A4V3JR81_9LEPT|nr:phospholipid carrier-dependent glycosyltransferase [Leptospira sarikeiensis]TGL58945.1 phospholipid carrier-dependent glycosyltransferase [Leptospira sarikeiensis]